MYCHCLILPLPLPLNSAGASGCGRRSPPRCPAIGQPWPVVRLPPSGATGLPARRPTHPCPSPAEWNNSRFVPQTPESGGLLPRSLPSLANSTFGLCLGHELRQRLATIRRRRLDRRNVPDRKLPLSPTSVHRILHFLPLLHLSHLSLNLSQYLSLSLLQQVIRRSLRLQQCLYLVAEIRRT